MIFDARASGRFAAANIAPGPPASVAESVLSAFDDIAKNDLAISDDILLEREYDAYLADVAERTGQRMDNPMLLVAPPRLGVEVIGDTLRLRAGAEQELFDQIAKLAEDDPELLLRSPEDIRAAVAGVRRLARERRADVAAREGLVGSVAAFGASTAAFFTDPPLLASMAFGAPLASSILRGALIEAGIATGIEVPVQLGVQAARPQFGEDPSFREAAANVALAGAGAGVFSATLRGGVLGGQALLRRVRRAERVQRLTPEAEDAKAFVERQTELDTPSPFGPEGAAEHKAKSSAALAAVRAGEVAELGEPQARPRLDPPAEPPRAFDPSEGLAPVEDGAITAARALAEAARATAAARDATRVLRQAFGGLDQTGRLDLLRQVRTPPAPPRITRLTEFLRRAGGLRDEGGDVAAIIGGPRGRPGLINNRTGLSLDRAGEQAFESGFFDARPDTGELLDALAGDFAGDAPRFADPEDALAFFDARDVTRELGELNRAFSDLDIDLRALDDGQVLARLDEQAEQPSVATQRAAGQARAARAAAEAADEAEDAALAAIEQEVRDAFADDPDARVVLEDELGNVIEMRAQDALDEIAEDETLLNEWLACAGVTRAAAGAAA